ncbi:NAD(P)/FAD-dependent oxidoreductase [Roseomonas populi]|uniref:FAD-dependent monooxygenase n=1 Tax=Roseomonas populi TaxID=3121582 RepID=A0ABT1X0K6_9PROT|nr:FAD-dependent oxidoreductase [Roseomonas pecuniae]MCR0980913.1 FAD-dependent monooxygenase [Roseomonas pecuniae]
MTEVLVVGGGPAGAAAALRLAQGGAEVTLVEREPAAREKVCGEFLGPDAAALLEGLGLSLPCLGAVPIGAARLASGAREAAWALPFGAWSLPRAVLDEALLDLAAGAGARVLRGAVVLAAGREGAEWCARLAGGTTLHGAALVLATGKHELRGHARAKRGGSVGLKLPLRLAAPMPAEVVLLPFDGGYAGLQPRPEGGANLCAALHAVESADAPSLLARVSAGSDRAGALLRGAEPLLPRPMAVAGVPYGFRHRDGAAPEPGLYRVGDQFAVVPSLAGDGVAMALAGGEEVARAILSGRPAGEFHAALNRRLDRPMRWAGLIARGLDRAPGSLALAARIAPALARLAAARTRLPGFSAA